MDQQPTHWPDGKVITTMAEFGFTEPEQHALTSRPLFAASVAGKIVVEVKQLMAKTLGPVKVVCSREVFTQIRTDVDAVDFAIGFEEGRLNLVAPPICAMGNVIEVDSKMTGLNWRVVPVGDSSGVKGGEQNG